MKKLLYFVNLLLMLICFTSCEKEAYKASDLIPTPTYRIYNPVVTKNVTDDMYEFYVYRQVPMLGIYKSSDYAQCHVEDMRNYVDNSDNEAYKFEFDRIVSVNENGDEVLNHYSIVFCKDRTPIFNQETGVSEYKESTLTVTKSDGTLIKRYDPIAVLERTKYLDKE